MPLTAQFVNETLVVKIQGAVIQTGGGGGGGGGLTAVSSDATLTGSGTPSSPLSVATPLAASLPEGSSSPPNATDYVWHDFDDGSGGEWQALGHIPSGIPDEPDNPQVSDPPVRYDLQANPSGTNPQHEWVEDPMPNPPAAASSNKKYELQVDTAGARSWQEAPGAGSTGVTIQDSGVQEGSQIETLNFGNNLDVSVSGGVATVDGQAGGGGGGTALSDDAVLDLAKGTRTAADRDKALGSSKTNQNELALLTFAQAHYKVFSSTTAANVSESDATSATEISGNATGSIPPYGSNVAHYVYFGVLEGLNSEITAVRRGTATGVDLTELNKVGGYRWWRSTSTLPTSAQNDALQFTTRNLIFDDQVEQRMLADDSVGGAQLDPDAMGYGLSLVADLLGLDSEWVDAGDQLDFAVGTAGANSGHVAYHVLNLADDLEYRVRLETPTSASDLTTRTGAEIKALVAGANASSSNIIQEWTVASPANTIRLYRSGTGSLAVNASAAASSIQVQFQRRQPKISTELANLLIAAAVAQSDAANAAARAAIQREVDGLSNAGGLAALVPLIEKIKDFFTTAGYLIHAAVDRVIDNPDFRGVYDNIGPGTGEDAYTDDVTVAEEAHDSSFTTRSLNYGQLALPTALNGTTRVAASFDFSTLEDAASYKFTLFMQDTFLGSPPSAILTGAALKALVAGVAPADNNTIIPDQEVVVRGGDASTRVTAEFTLYRGSTSNIVLQVQTTFGSGYSFTFNSAHVDVVQITDTGIRMTGTAWESGLFHLRGMLKLDSTIRDLAWDRAEHFPIMRLASKSGDATKREWQVNSFTRAVPSQAHSGVHRDIPLAVGATVRGYTYTMVTDPIPTDATTIREHYLDYDYVVENNANGSEYFHARPRVLLPVRRTYSLTGFAQDTFAHRFSTNPAAGTVRLPSEWWPDGTPDTARDLRAILIQDRGTPQIAMNFGATIIGGSDIYMPNEILDHMVMTLKNPTAGSVTIEGIVRNATPSIHMQYGWTPQESTWNPWARRFVAASDKSLTIEFSYRLHPQEQVTDVSTLTYDTMVLPQTVNERILDEEIFDFSALVDERTYRITLEVSGAALSLNNVPQTPHTVELTGAQLKALASTDTTTVSAGNRIMQFGVNIGGTPPNNTTATFEVFRSDTDRIAVVLVTGFYNSAHPYSTVPKIKVQDVRPGFNVRRTVRAPDNSAFVEFLNGSYDASTRRYTVVVGIGRPNEHLDTRLLVRSAVERQVYDEVTASVARVDRWLAVSVFGGPSSGLPIDLTASDTEHLLAFGMAKDGVGAYPDGVAFTAYVQSTEPTAGPKVPGELTDPRGIHWPGIEHISDIVWADPDDVEMLLISQTSFPLLRGHLLNLINHEGEQWASGEQPRVTMGDRQVTETIVMPKLKLGQADTDTVADRLKNVEPQVQALTAGANVDWNVSNGATATLTADQNLTLNAPTGGVDGGVYLLRVTQDTTGSRTITLHADIQAGDEAAPTLTTTGGETDVLLFTYAGSEWFYLGIKKGY